MSCCGEGSPFDYSSTAGGIPSPAGFPAITTCCENDIYIAPQRLQPPQITSSLMVNVVPTIFFTYVITATNNPDLYYAPTFPAWMTFDGVDTLSGTPPSDTASSVFTFQVGATNVSGSTVVTVQGGIAPFVTSSSTPSGTSGELFEYLIEATNNPISYHAFDLPAWASFDGVQTVSGTPPILCIDAEYNFTVTATNIYGTSIDHPVTVETVAFPPPDITSSLSVAAQEGVPFSYVLTANRSPTSFDATNLPAWASFDLVDTIIGTPTLDCFPITYPKVETADLSATNICGTGPTSQLEINETGFQTQLLVQPVVNIVSDVYPLGFQSYWSPYTIASPGDVGPGTNYPLGFTESEIQKIFDGSTSWDITSDVVFSGTSDLVGAYNKDFSGTHNFILAQQTCPPTPQTISFDVRGGDTTIVVELFDSDVNGKWYYYYNGLYYPYMAIEYVDNMVDFVFYTFLSAFNFEGDCSKLWQGGTTPGQSITSSNSTTTATLTFDDAIEYNASIFSCDADIHANQIHSGGIDISFT